MYSYNSFKKYISQNVDNFNWEGEENLKEIVNYFGTDESIYDKSKGLLIFGSIGVGKTSFLRLIQKWLQGEDKFSYNPTNKVVSKFNAEGDKGIEIYKDSKDRFFDDLGSEDIGKNYGNNVEVFEKIIYDRYDSFEFKGVKTHFTTNLTPIELEAKYGLRAYDRLKKMVNVITWHTNESKRGYDGFRLKELNSVVVEPTEEEKEVKREEGVKWHYDYWKNNDIMFGASDWIYLRLEKQGKFKWSEKDLIDAEERAISYLTREAKEQGKETAFEGFAIALQKGGKIEIQARKVLLEKYYNGIKRV